MTIFEGKKRPMTKMIVTFSVNNGIRNTAFKFSNQKTPYWLNENRKPGFGGTFSSISVVLLAQLFPNQ